MTGYKRHAFTPTGVSPFGVPGDGKPLVVTDSDEHDEAGHIIEDSATRNRMVQKRLLAKLPLIKREISPPFLYGEHRADVVVAGWGSTYGVMKEAVEELSKTTKIAMLHFSEVYPFPDTGSFDYLKLLRSAKRTLCIEQNATGQFARLMKVETGYEFGAHVHKFDGRPFLREELVREIQANIKDLI
jgi:2-oxoglutarate ferredoxin oxidoreductase subunit alpha